MMDLVESNLGMKRKQSESISKDEPFKKKRKKLLFKKIKPPTAEEINRLRETENIFHSNLFRLQIEEMLKEIKLADNSYSKITSWIDKLKSFLANIEFSYCISKEESISIPNVALPNQKCVKNADISFEFLKPKSIGIFGSFSVGCVLKHFTDIDIYVEMPKTLFKKEDYLNERYLRKRNVYLSCIASKLIDFAEEISMDHDIQFMITNDIDKPVLRVKPSEERLQKYNIIIHAIPEKDTFRESRFVPSLNNIRYGWFFNTIGDGRLNYPTPYYNSLISQDLVTLENEKVRKTIFEENTNLKDAVLLLKVWLRQRKLCEGIGAFSGFLLSMFIVYLFKKRKLNKHMSSYQVVRIIWLSFDQMNWHEEGISLAEVVNESKTNLDIFQSCYDVIFVDVTGNVNLASALSLSKYQQLRAESKYAVECLDNSKTNSFPALFMMPVNHLYAYDQLLHFKEFSTIRKMVKNYATEQLQVDLRNNKLRQFLKLMIDMLTHALGDRVHEISYNIEPCTLCWPVGRKMPSFKEVKIGLKINPEFAYSIISRGPTANLPEALEFRKFWGEKSELRRFKDGDICEAVCWAKSDDCLQKKRNIVRDIVEYILKSKFNISSDRYTYVMNEMENVAYATYNEIFNTVGTGEEACLNIISAFGNLSSDLRHLKNLPLDITATRGTSSVFRYSDPCPVRPNTHSTIKKNLEISDRVTLFKSGNTKHIPLYIAPVEAVIQFSLSNKWPEDIEAIRKLQTAFYIQLASSLNAQCKYVCYAYADRIDILKDGYVFRLRISNNNEINAIKRLVNEEGVIEYSDNTESLLLEKTLVQLPALTGAIHGLHQEYAAFGPTSSIAKRWLRCQLIDEFYLADITIDLLLAYLFLNPQPYTVSHQPQTMFIRFLKMISNANWFSETIIVNFNDILTREEILEIDSVTSKNRNKLPPLVIVTPFDKYGITWTREQPSVVVLRRLLQLAQATLRIIEPSLLGSMCDDMKTIFRPPLKGYDLLIWTIPTVNSLRWLAIDVDENTLTEVKDTPEFSKLPIVDFHPIRSYVDELRKHFGEMCLFFYDFYGGNLIGVVLKPIAKSAKEFKVSNMKCTLEKKNKLIFDLDAMIDSFRILGNGIVSHIECCTENTE